MRVAHRDLARIPGSQPNLLTEQILTPSECASPNPASQAAHFNCNLQLLRVGVSTVSDISPGSCFDPPQRTLYRGHEETDIADLFGTQLDAILEQVRGGSSTESSLKALRLLGERRDAVGIGRIVFCDAPRVCCP